MLTRCSQVTLALNFIISNQVLLIAPKFLLKLNLFL